MTTLLTAILSVALFAGAPHTVYLPQVQHISPDGRHILNCAPGRLAQATIQVPVPGTATIAWWIVSTSDPFDRTSKAEYRAFTNPGFWTTFRLPPPGYYVRSLTWGGPPGTRLVNSFCAP